MEKYTNIEWIIIKNSRNKIVHDYEGIKLNLIWDIVTNDIVQLKVDLQEILDNNNSWFLEVKYEIRYNNWYT